jgi:hypothetical protein
VTIDSIACRHNIDGEGPEELAADFNLTLPQVMAALSFYFANKEILDEEIAEYERESDEAMAEYYAKHGRLRDRIQAKLQA